MSNVQSKEFNSMSEARGFAGNLGILSMERYNVQAGKVVLHWSPLQASIASGHAEGLKQGQRYAVLRESPHAYFIRSGDGRVHKIDRHTRICGRATFNIH